MDETAYKRCRGKHLTIMIIEFDENLLWKLEKSNPRWRCTEHSLKWNQRAMRFGWLSKKILQIVRSKSEILVEERDDEEHKDFVKYVSWCENDLESDGDLPKAPEAPEGSEGQLRDRWVRLMIVFRIECTSRDFYIKKRDVQVFENIMTVQLADSLPK